MRELPVPGPRPRTDLRAPGRRVTPRLHPSGTVPGSREATGFGLAALRPCDVRNGRPSHEEEAGKHR